VFSGQDDDLGGRAKPCLGRPRFSKILCRVGTAVGQLDRESKSLIAVSYEAFEALKTASD
jgi:hypothetical protein